MIDYSPHAIGPFGTDSLLWKQNWRMDRMLRRTKDGPRRARGAARCPALGRTRTDAAKRQMIETDLPHGYLDAILRRPVQPFKPLQIISAAPRDAVEPNRQIEVRVMGFGGNSSWSEA